MPHTLSPAHLVQRIDQVLDDVYRAGQIEVEGGERVAIFPTSMRREQCEAIARVLAQVGARRTLETGFAFGLSGIFMVRAALQNGADPLAGASHTALDPFQARTWKRAGLRLFARAGISHLLRFFEARSELHLPRLIEAGEQFDAIVVDGDHRFESVFMDLLFTSRLVRPGGAIIVDDLWMPSVRAALEYFTTNVGLVREDRKQDKDASNFAVLRVPEQFPKRTWDHYIPFDAGLTTASVVGRPLSAAL